MNTLQYILIGLVALIHIYIVILEMVLWTKPKGIKTFGLKSKEFAEETKTLAANQGLYNGFLAAGLIWAMISQKTDVAIFFLCCVFVAGIYGAYSTKKPRIFFVQSIPALLGLVFLLF
ncbi:Membrane protein [Tenacibaculum sp. 190130A14a]|uniref:Membrane protein n=1 Tax=Tenacibaculum polynesiense TaxID=3137857 RepID=A0ABP1EVJ6_9FLAO